MKAASLLNLKTQTSIFKKYKSAGNSLGEAILGFTRSKHHAVHQSLPEVYRKHFFFLILLEWRFKI
jgi:hypothetical protein